VVARLLLGIAIVLGARDAAADAYIEGHVHFDRGQDAYKHQQFKVALAEFRAAYTLAPFPQILYDIARCEEELGQLADAIVSYTQYAAVAPLGAVDARQVRDHAARLKSALERSQPPPGRYDPDADRRLLMPAFDAPPASPAPVPVYRRWWVWTSVGVVIAAGVGIGLGVALGGSSPPPLTFPALRGAP
jgi:hypothetical protein